MAHAQRQSSTRLTFQRVVVAGIAIAAFPATVPAATPPTATTQGPAITDLLKTGWQIAGYSQAFDNRSTFILFRHPEQTYLVQCRVGYDVTRTPSVYAICYELR